MIEKDQDSSDDNPDQFDELERKFHEVVSELVLDQNLINFKVEYEKLHQKLVESHEQNMKLIEKYRQLNDEIIANANKVSSVMQLSQTDQMTISDLRNEFEKAWKLVEISQNKEAKSNDIIESLKQEITKLSKIVDEGNSLNLQRTSSHRSDDCIDVLKKEITKHKDNINNLELELSKLKNDKDKISSKCSALSGEVNKLNDKYDEARTEADALNEDIVKIHNNIKDIKAQMNQYCNTIKENSKLIANANMDNRNIITIKFEVLSVLKSEQDEMRLESMALATKKKLLEDKIKENSNIISRTNRTKSRIDEKEGQIAVAKSELSSVSSDNELLSSQYANYKQIYNNTITDKKQNISNISKVMKEQHSLFTQVTQVEGKANGVRRTIDKLKKDITVLENERGIEINETEMIKDQNELLGNESLNLKTVIHSLGSKSLNLQGEIENYMKEKSEIRSYYLQVLDENRVRESNLSESAKILTDLYESIKQQNYLNQGLKSDRDLVQRSLLLASKETVRLGNENKKIIMSISAMKSEIKKRDKQCIETHIKYKKVYLDINDLKESEQKLRQDIIESEMKNSELISRIKKSRYLIQQTDLQNMKQRQVVDDLKELQFSLKETIAKKKNELNLLRGDIYNLGAEIKVKGLSFDKKLKEVEERRNELINEVNKQKNLMTAIKHSDALRKESIQLTRTIILEQGKCKALEEELERPINVHRWRLMEGNNPELLQLIKSTIELRDRLMVNINRLDRLKQLKEMTKREAEQLDNRVPHFYEGNFKEEYNYLQECIKAKDQQLSIIKKRIVNQSATVSSQR